MSAKQVNERPLTSGAMPRRRRRMRIDLVKLLGALHLPLLNKELIEQAQSKRTYLLRAIYALVLYGAALTQYHEIVGGTSGGLMNLGRGRELFQVLVTIQAVLIVMLLPPLTCGALTVEKEKDTLALLLLTKLNPWTIVFEKLLSRIFAMGTYQFLSLPLFAIVYGMGGVDIELLIVSIAALISLTIVVSSISILCSTWFRTTASAFVMTYCLIGCCALFFSPMTLADGRFRQSGWRLNPDSGVSMGFFLALAAPTVLLGMSSFLSLICLHVSANVLVARAFIPQRNLVLELFQRLDAYFNDLNKRTTGGIVLVPDRETLPTFDAIAWRETRKKSLGTFRYQFRVLLLLLTPLLFVIAAVITDLHPQPFSRPFQLFPAFFWVISIICLTIHSTAAMPSERIRQTLDVLLVIPMTSAEIVRQKLAGVRRLIFILSVPFVVLIGFQIIWTAYVTRGLGQFQQANFLMSLVSTALPVVIYMPLLMWIGFQLGLRMRTQIQAVISTFAVVGATCAVPVLVSGGADNWSQPIDSIDLPWPMRAFVLAGNLVTVLSPINVILPPYELKYDNYYTWMMLAFHFLFYALCWSYLRRNALKNFSRIVGRTEPGGADEGATKVESPPA